MSNRLRAALAALIVAAIAVLNILLVDLGGDPPTTSTTWTPPTLTTLPPVTTSTVPVTTSTEAPDTTTGPSTTTTTHHPPTTHHPTTTVPPVAACLDRSFTFMLRDNDRAIRWTDLDYCRRLPYEQARYWWVDGDRMGYGCAYTFTLDTGLPSGVDELQIRTTVARTGEGSYAGVADRRMSDGTLTYAGHPALTGGNEVGDCPLDLVTDYRPEACISGPPVLTLWHDHHLIDIRDWTTQPAATGVRFCLLDNITEPIGVIGPGMKSPAGCPNVAAPGWGCEPHTVLQRVIVGIVVDIDGTEVIPAVAYYDVLVPESRIQID